MKINLEICVRTLMNTAVLYISTILLDNEIRRVISLDKTFFALDQGLFDL